MKFVLSLICICAVGVAQASDDTLIFPHQNLKKVYIHNSYGNVQVAPTTTNDVRIVPQKEKWGKRCELRSKISKGTLMVHADDKGWVMDNECKVNLLVSVPKSVKLELRSGNGDVSVVGTRGDLDIKVGSGKIRVDAEIKKLSALSGNGSIKFSGHAQKLNIKTAMGDIEMNVKNNIENGSITAKAGKGDIMVSLPQSSKIRANTSAQNGSIRNDFPREEKRAEVDMELSVGSGDIQIIGN